jgi:glycine hydroxymethyltransferase
MTKTVASAQNWDSSPFDPWLAEDPDVAALVRAEAQRQATTLQLIASENFTSVAVLAASGSVLTNKYSEGYPGRRYYGGNQIIDEVEDLARNRLTALFGAEHANVQPHAGAPANFAVYQALLDPGDTVLAMRLDQGGHLTHGSPASITSKIWRFVAYGVTPASSDPGAPGEVIDFDDVAETAKRERPKLIVAGATAYPRQIDPQAFRDIADAVGAQLMFDIAHPAGLVAGGAHPNPVGVADVVTLTTHKTLRGPRGGAILCREGLAKAVDSAVFPGLQGGPLEHVIAAKAVAFREAAQPAFRTYAGNVVSNARALAAALAAEGFRLVSGGTDNHLLLVDLRPFDPELTGKQAQEVLDRAGITLNRNTIPDDPRSAFVTSGLRLGTAAQTTAGMGPAEMTRIASLMARALRGLGDESVLAKVRGEVLELCAGFPPYPQFARGATGGVAGGAG